LIDNPEIDALLTETAREMGFSKEMLAGLIQFESAGTWSPIVSNSGSSALGIYQITNGAAREMAKVLVREGKLTQEQADRIKTSRDLLSIYNTTEKQIGLIVTYAKATHVRVPGEFSGSLYGYMKTLPTATEKYETYLIGHFQPSYVGESRYELLPAKVRAVNGPIRTTGDYVTYVNNTVK